MRAPGARARRACICAFAQVRALHVCAGAARSLVRSLVRRHSRKACILTQCSRAPALGVRFFSSHDERNICNKIGFIGAGNMAKVSLCACASPPCAYAQVHARTPGVRCVRGVRVRVHVCPTPGHHPQRKLHAIMAIDLELHPATLKCMCVLHTRLNPKTKP